MLNLWTRWTSLPVKARYYIGASTFVFALAGEYITSKVNDEVHARDQVIEEIVAKKNAE